MGHTECAFTLDTSPPQEVIKWMDFRGEPWTELVQYTRPTFARLSVSDGTDVRDSAALCAIVASF